MKYLGITDDQLYLAVARAGDDSIVQDRTQVAGNFVEGRVCEGCNSGWMRDLENQTMDLIKPLIDGKSNLLTLSDEERTRLAKWAAKTAFVISHASPLKKTPPKSQMRYLKDHKGSVPPQVEIYGQQSLWRGDFDQIQRNQWLHVTGRQGEQPSPPDGSYKIAFRFRALMLLVAHWSEPNSMPVIAASLHIPLWPINKLHITYHRQLPPLDQTAQMAALDRFSTALAVCSLDDFIPVASTN